MLLATAEIPGAGHVEPAPGSQNKAISLVRGAQNAFLS